MSSPEPTLRSVEGPGPASTESAGRIFEDVPQWPVTRLPAVALTALLCLCMVGPAALSGLRGGQWLALAVPAILATASARVLFEAIAPARRRRLRAHLGPAAVAAGVSVALLSGSAAIIGLRWSLAAALSTAGLVGGALTAAGVVCDLEIRVRMSLRRVFFAGSQVARRDLEYELERRSDAAFVGAHLAGSPAEAKGLVRAVLDANATVLVLDRDAMAIGELVEVASELNLHGIQVRDLVSYYEYEFKKVPLAELTPTWFLFDIASVHDRPVSRAVRRLLELAVAVPALVVALPFLLVAWVAIRLTSRGPGLYRQPRVGRHGSHFTLLKLRTMRGQTASEPRWATTEAHRITPLGRGLRRFRLDEVPQLWNVIRGELALVGPRPEQIAIAEQLERQIPFYNARHSVRPGLTGWAQVNLGYAGSLEGTLAKLQRDLYYVKHASLRLDALILWLTLKTMLTGRG